MYKQETLSQFNGFGNPRTLGSYLFSSGFKLTRDKLTPSWKAVEETVDAGTTLERQNWFVQRTDVYAVGVTGKIVQKVTNNWTQVRNPGASSGNGLVVDQKNRLLYARNQTLGMYDGTTWTDSWKAFDSTISDFRPMELYEDKVLVGNKNKVAVLFTSDDSFTDDGFTLPDSFLIRCIKAGRNGVLIGANINNRGYLILWDTDSSRSSAPWIPLETKISSIAVDENGSWIVTTSKGFLKTNGYLVAPFAEMPNVRLNDAYLSQILPGGTLYHDNRLYVAFKAFTLPVPQMPHGLLIHNTQTNSWEFCPPANYQTSPDTNTGAIYLDSNLNLYMSYSTQAPAAAYIARIEESITKIASLITNELGQGNAWKHAEALVVNVGFSPNGSSRYPTSSWTLKAKIYDFKRQLYGYGLTAAISPSLNKLVNTGSNSLFQTAEVGDEVTILSGQNAGQVRHITLIENPGTDTETWTLDSNLSGLTEASIYLQVCPFQTIGSYSITDKQTYFFNIKRKVKAKRFLLKLILETPEGNLMLTEINSLTFIYDEIGFI